MQFLKKTLFCFWYVTILISTFLTLSWHSHEDQIEGVYVTTQHMSVMGSRTRSRIRPMIWHRAFNRWAVTWWYKRFSPQNSSAQSQTLLSASLAPTTLSHAPSEQLCHTTQAEVRLVSGPRSCIHRERRHGVSLRRGMYPACSTDFIPMIPKLELLEDKDSTTPKRFPCENLYFPLGRWWELCIFRV